MIFYTCGRPYGTGRARARTVCTRARARELYARSARALYVRTARAHCTYRTRTVRPDCTQKVCAKICCVLFKICCVVSKSVAFFSKSAVFFCTYGPRVRWPYGTARARARSVRTCDARARAVRTVCANHTRGLCGKSVCPISLCCFQNPMCFFPKSVAFFRICGVLFARTVRAYGGRTVWHARVRCARTCGAHARACTVYRACAGCTCAERAVRVYGARETHVCCAASAFSC